MIRDVWREYQAKELQLLLSAFDCFFLHSHRRKKHVWVKNFQYFNYNNTKARNLPSEPEGESFLICLTTDTVNNQVVPREEKAM